MHSILKIIISSCMVFGLNMILNGQAENLVIDSTNSQIEIENFYITNKRKIVSRDISKLAQTAINEKGKVTSKVCINRRGDVMIVEIVENETTIESQSIRKNVIKTLYKYKFEEGSSEDCGKIVLNFENFNAIR